MNFTTSWKVLLGWQAGRLPPRLPCASRAKRHGGFFFREFVPGCSPPSTVIFEATSWPNRHLGSGPSYQSSYSDPKVHLLLRAMDLSSIFSVSCFAGVAYVFQHVVENAEKLATLVMWWAFLLATRNSRTARSLSGSTPEQQGSSSQVEAMPIAWRRRW